MIRSCSGCAVTYDDAAQTTICPHGRFLSLEDAAQKDLAIGLIGKDLRWAHLADGTRPVLRIQSVGWNGMVTLYGWTGEFSPHCFVRVETES